MITAVFDEQAHSRPDWATSAVCSAMTDNPARNDVPDEQSSRRVRPSSVSGCGHRTRSPWPPHVMSKGLADWHPRSGRARWVVASPLVRRSSEPRVAGVAQRPEWLRVDGQGATRPPLPAGHPVPYVLIRPQPRLSGLRGNGCVSPGVRQIVVGLTTRIVAPANPFQLAEVLAGHGLRAGYAGLGQRRPDLLR